MPKTATLPTAPVEYNIQDQIVTRRTIEQVLQDVYSDTENTRLKKSKDSSLAMRRFQFLLMGAS